MTTLEPTREPTVEPTLEPTLEPTTKIISTITWNPNDVNVTAIVIVVSMGGLLVILCMLLQFMRSRRRRARESKEIYIKNPMIIAIYIGLYDENPINPDINGYLDDLSGVDKDIQTTHKLFSDTLNYEIYPQYDISSWSYIKQRWTKNELIKFLIQKAQHLNENIVNKNNKYNRYDGLCVIIRGYGIDENIITSDYKTISKQVIHRIFSKRPLSRFIPRLFMFDCVTTNTQNDTEWEIESNDMEQSSDDELMERDHDVPNSMTSIQDELNFDYRLILIHAFKADDNDEGSLVIPHFIKKLSDNIMMNNTRFLHDVLGRIQQELHSMNRKQLITYMFNDGTEYTIFLRRRHENNKKYNKVFFSYTCSNFHCSLFNVLFT